MILLATIYLCIDSKGVRFLKQIADMKSSNYVPLYISFYFKFITPNVINN